MVSALSSGLQPGQRVFVVGEGDEVFILASVTGPYAAVRSLDDAYIIVATEALRGAPQHDTSASPAPQHIIEGEF